MEELSRTYAEKLGDFVAGLNYEALPAAVIEKAKLHILDSIGVALAGFQTEWARVTTEVAKALGGPPESRVIGTAHRFPAANAALVNGAMIYGLDFDDTYISGQVHVSSFVVPALLAVAEANGASGKAALVAAAVGYEVSCRIARASFDKSAGRSHFSNRGFHTTGVFSAMGAATVAAKLKSMDADTLASALGIAASQASGVLQSRLEGTWAKTFDPGWGAHGGIIATHLAQAGFAAPHQIFEGELGFFKSFLGSGNYDLKDLTRDLGSQWNMLDISFKLYPAAQGAHFFLESALHLERQYGLRTEDIEEIRCTVTPFRVHAHFEPRNLCYTPPNGYIARFSLPYLLAVRLLRDEVGLDAFAEQSLKDAKVLELASRITYVVDANADLPENKGHILIRTKDGRSHEHKQTVIRGTPERPATKEEIQRKFRLNAKQVLSGERIEAIVDCVSTLERLDDVGRLVDMTGPTQ